MEFVSGAYWDVGTRSGNEDSVLLQIVQLKNKSAAFGVVSDGIGGLKEGHIASGYVTEMLGRVFYREMIPIINRHENRALLERCMQRCLHGICEDLSEYAAAKGIRLGATVSALLIFGNRFMITHLGDCRIYECRQDAMKVINTMHSAGVGAVSKCVGSFPYMQPQIILGKVCKKTGFLIASDGFYSLMDEDASLFDPARLKNDAAVEKMLLGMGALVRKRGQKDNASAVYVGCM